MSSKNTPPQSTCPSSPSNNDTMAEKLVKGETPDSSDTNLRYLAYTSRFRTILTSAHRYVAYTSDIGESFRPIAHPKLIRAAYGISWLYLTGDVASEGWKAYKHNYNPGDSKKPKPAAPTFMEDYRTVIAQRAIFQTLASMALPAFTIHSVVRYSGTAMAGVKNVRVRTWGPVGLGLAVVPFLPYVFDEPVEHAVDWAFERGYHAWSGNKEKVKEL